MREIEVKIEVRDADEARRRLGAAGAVALSPRVFEDNRVWDDRDGTLRATRRLLRLRSAGGRHTLTFKKPPEGSGEATGYKVRIEHETTVGDPGETARILEGLGYRVAWRYQKYRQSYRLEGVEIDLDETPLGVFLELEGPPAAIDRAARALGFGREHYVVATYRGLARERSGGREPGDLVFPAEGDEGNPGTS